MMIAGESEGFRLSRGFTHLAWNVAGVVEEAAAESTHC